MKETARTSVILSKKKTCPLLFTTDESLMIILKATCWPIVRFTVVCLVAKPLNRSEARVDFVVIQTLLLFICKSLCYHAKLVLRLYHFKVTPIFAFIQRLGYISQRTVKWSIVLLNESAMMSPWGAY